MTWAYERSNPMKAAGVYDVDTAAAINVKLDLLMKQIDFMGVHSVQVICEVCGEGHATQDCQWGNPFAQHDPANFVGNFPRPNNPYSNTYNPGWRNHPNFSWSNNGQAWGNYHVQQGSPSNHALSKLTTLEEAMLALTANTTSFIQETKQQFINCSAAIKNLEVQVGQLATQLTQRPQGSLPSNTMTNPKEQAHAVILRSETKKQGVREMSKAENDEEVTKIENSQSSPISVEQEVFKKVQGHSKPQAKSQGEVNPNAQYREEPKPLFPSRFQNVEVKFHVLSSIKHSEDLSACYYVDVVETKNDEWVMECMADPFKWRLNGAKFGEKEVDEYRRLFHAKPFDVG